MKTCKTFQKMIEKIAAAHGFDLYTQDPDRRGYELVVENDPYMPLAIAVLDRNIVSVSHIKRDEYGDRIYDPEVQFFTGYGPWVPITFDTPPFKMFGRIGGGFVRYAYLNEDASAIDRYYRKGMDDTGRFVNGMWLTNLRQQGFGKGQGRHNQPPAVSLESLQKELIQIRAAVLYRATQGAFIDAEDLCDSGRFFAERLVDLAVRTYRLEDAASDCHVSASDHRTALFLDYTD